MDLDSVNFDPKRYVLSLLKTSSIKDLIKKNNDIEEDIKIHDHQIQSLVFENYSKFISSIDTVRQMKNNICQVDEKLKVLDSSMEKISELAIKIDSTFSVKRKQIQKLDTINKDLQKLKNLCDFPNIFKQDLIYFKSVSQNKLNNQANTLFSNSIESYESSYLTLIELKDQPLIAPIYRQSTNKVDQVRTILRNLQAQFKGKSQSKTLRQITRKLLIVSEDQVSVLRSYFLSWKQRLSQNSFKGQKLSLDQDLPQLLNSNLPQLNENLWSQFEQELLFLSAVRPKLNLTEQTEILINNYIKDIFNFVLSNYHDTVPTYCLSLKGFVQANHLIVTRIKKALLGFPNKIHNQIENKLFEKVDQIGKSMLRFLFGRLKLGFLKQLGETKKQASTILISEQSLKLAYQKILNPLKQYLTTNYKLLLNDLEYLQNSKESVFNKQQTFNSAVYLEVEELLKAIAYLSSLQTQYLSQETYTLINSGYSGKMHRGEKNFIENSIKDYINESKQSGCWFVVTHHFLSILCNHFGKKIIENTQKRLEMQTSHDYAKIFTLIKNCISKNLITLATFYSDNTLKNSECKNILNCIEQFICVINIIFPDSKRAILKKPSFLSESILTHQTELLTAKKMHIIEKKSLNERSSVIAIFVRKLLKGSLINIRKGIVYKQVDVYSLVQICYELSRIQQQSQISAFYYLLKNHIRDWNVSKEGMEDYYSNERKNLGNKL